jgi:hypothetical protein
MWLVGGSDWIGEAEGLHPVVLGAQEVERSPRIHFKLPKQRNSPAAHQNCIDSQS